MKNTRMRIAAISVATFTAISLVAATAPAQAADFSVTADKSTSLVAAGDVVKVTLNNLPAEAGLYVRLCAGTLADVSKARPTNCFGQGAWVSSSASSITQHATDASAGPVSLDVKAVFTSGTTTIDCQAVACGIHVRRDHLAPTDFSLDRFIPVTFASVPAQIVKSGVSLTSSKVKINVVNLKGQKVSFVVGTKKFTRIATSDNYTFSAPAPKASWFVASAYVGSKKIVSKKFTK